VFVPRTYFLKPDCGHKSHVASGVALALSSPALGQNRADAAELAEAINNLAQNCADSPELAKAINNLAMAINNQEAGIEYRYAERQRQNFINTYGYDPYDPCKGKRSSYACQ